MRRKGWKRGMAAVLLAVLLAVNALADTTGSFHFVQITDTHFGSKDHFSLTRRMVAEINALPFPVACVLHTGDIMADAIEKPDLVEEGLSILADLKAPIHYVPGNHDIRTTSLEKTVGIYTNRFGPLFATQTYARVVFALVCTEPLARSFAIESYDPLERLEAALISIGDRPVIVVHHTPSVEDFHKRTVHPGWPEPARGRWSALLNRHNVKAVIAGHFHRTELHWIGSVPLYVGGPVAEYWNRRASFRVYEYRDGRLGFRDVVLE